MKSPASSRLLAVLTVVALLLLAACVPPPTAPPPATSSTAPVPAAGSAPGLWQVYDQSLKGAKYIDLTHTLTPSIPVWAGFGPAKFGATVHPDTGQPYTYDPDGFEATRYELSTDQYGTQLDPPAHWAPEYPAIDELPATYAVRPLVVISIVDQVAKDPNYHLQVQDILDWEAKNGQVPAGSVVMVRSDWSKEWPNPELATRTSVPRRLAGCAEVPARAAQDPHARPRAAGHRQHAHLGRRVLADAQRLHPGRGGGRPGPGR